MPRLAYFDCFSGISGDMTLGALIDLGVSLPMLESTIQSLGLPEVRIEATEVKKEGFRAIGVQIVHPPEHAHRHLHHITAMLDASDRLTPAAKTIATKIFHEIAVAEAKVHGTTIQKVHFHEVGAIDSIADIVGTAVGLDALGIERVVAATVPTGTGAITIAHGRVALPAPATAEILRGVPLRDCAIEAELTTPTGAAILKSQAADFGPMPAMTIDRIGYGAGSRDLEGQANVLRVVLGQTDGETALLSDQVVLMETNLDDCPPMQAADVAQRLLAAGALDVWQTPCVMKKGRAGIVMSVLAKPTDSASLEAMLLQLTPAIGVRRMRMDRHKLPRRQRTVTTSLGELQGKEVVLPGGQMRWTVEDDEARRVARQHGISTEEVRQTAAQAYKASV
ncbi:MAG: nickel pincer cofactor biosynthesis protein LarC [Planctomycetota bacterium]